MGESATATVMRRIVRPMHPTAAEPVTPARALRQALIRAAERSVGLTLSVLGIRQDIAPLDDLLPTVEDDLMLAALADDSGPAGFLGIDLQTRAALIEMQTVGQVRTATAAARRVTHADIAMAEPFMSLFLAELLRETAETVLDGWVAGYRLNGRFADLREVGLALSDRDYRVVRMTLDLGTGGRQGLIVLVLPMPAQPSSARAAQPAPDWSDALATNVLGARSDVTAILHRLRLSLGTVESFELGQVIPLPGVSVASVRVETPDTALIGLARLGQLSGMRAVRLGRPPRRDMDETVALPPARR